MTLFLFTARLVGIALAFFIPFWLCFAIRNRWSLAYADRPLFFIGYFLFWSLLGIWFFRADFALAPINANIALPAFILLGSLLLAAGLYAAGQKWIPDVGGILQQYGHVYNKWVALDYRYLAVKTAEVLYQQVALVLVVLLLHTLLPSPLALALWFASLFGLVHLLIFSYWYWKKRVPGSSVVVFSVCSFLGGLVMPLFILQVPFGFVYSFCIHELYYPVIGAGFRFYLGKQARAATRGI